MKITDRTPFRNSGGKIDIFGRIQGSLKFGLSWYARLQAQDTVIALLGKILDQNYILLHNITLANTDIDLPLVLIGPPGIYMINVTHERGVFRAKDDEWGTISGEKFVPAEFNQVQRTVKLGHVLQIYLDRAGYKGVLVVDPILMAADPGMHIESVRSAARIVMSDALERFAISVNQLRPIFNTGSIMEIAQVIVNGPKKQAPAAPTSDSTAPGSVSGERDTTDVLFSPAQLQQDSNSAFSTKSLGFSFDEKRPDQQAPSHPAAQLQPATNHQPEAPPILVPPPPAPVLFGGAGTAAGTTPHAGTAAGTTQNTAFQTPAFQGSDEGYGNPLETGSQVFKEPEAQVQPFTDPLTQEIRDDVPKVGHDVLDASQGLPSPVRFAKQIEPGLPRNIDPAGPEAQPETGRFAKPASPASKKTGLFGMTTTQMLILGGILVFWLFAMIGFAIYIYINL